MAAKTFSIAIAGIFRAAIFIGVLALAGCATQDPRLTTVLATTRVTDIRIETVPDIRMGESLLNGVTRESQGAAVSRILRENMSRNLMGYPGGHVPARLTVTLYDVDVASTPRRIVGGRHSFIKGTVRLEAVRNGSLIAQSPPIEATDVTVIGGGPVGMIAAAAINAAVTPNQNAVATNLSDTFAKRVKDWLTPRKGKSGK